MSFRFFNYSIRNIHIKLTSQTCQKHPLKYITKSIRAEKETHNMFLNKSYLTYQKQKYTE